MLVRSFLPDLAAELGLTMVAPLPGGTLGAALVTDRDGQEFVLKADPTNTWRDRFARGAQLAEVLRLRGYPAPLHVATGEALDAAWSLQERLRGASPRPMNAAHASHMVALARMHADATALRNPIDEGGSIEEAIARLLARRDTARIAGELRNVLNEQAPRRDGDIVHNDFSHRNVLVIGDEVTGIIDWELAGTGDWRMDLATLGYWTALEPDAVAPDAASLVAAELQRECPPALRASFLARLALRHLDLDSRMRPRRLAALLRSIEERIAPQWRLLSEAS